MLRGDVSILASKLSVSKSTVYNLAEKIGIDLHPIYGRCNNTVDILSGKTLSQECDDWLEKQVNLINEFKDNRAKEKAAKNNQESDLCKTCQHMATKTTPAPAMFLLFGCKQNKITFGTESDWKAGNNQKKACKEYVKRV